MSQEGRHARFANGHWSSNLSTRLGKNNAEQEEPRTSLCGDPKRSDPVTVGVHTGRSCQRNQPYIVLPCKARPAESSPWGSSNQPRTSRPGYSSPGENPDLSWNFRPGNTHNHVRENPILASLEKSGYLSSTNISTGVVDTPVYKSITHVLARSPKYPR